MKRTRNRANERGTQVLELAVVLPVLALLALIVTEGASFVRVHQVLNNAAREGARLAVLPESSPYGTDHTAQVKATTVGYICNNNINFQGGGLPGCTNTNLTDLCDQGVIEIKQDILIPTATGTSISGSRVTVKCAYHLSWSFGLPAQINLGTDAEFPNQF